MTSFIYSWDPYKINSTNIAYKLINKLRTYLNVRHFENYFFDFQETQFPQQAKFLFEEVGNAVRKNKSSVVRRFVHDVYLHEENISEYFPIETKDWEIVHARTLHLSPEPLDISNSFAQVTMRFKTEDGKSNYIVFERSLTQNLSFYSWKIFVLNYEYFIK